MLKEIELVTVGDELMLGFTVDTNGAYIARRLAELGVRVVRRTTVGDDQHAIAGAVTEALERTHAVITTGGLGPTNDDLTREAVAAVYGRQMLFDEVHLAWMRDRWKKRFNREMPLSNRRQAMIPMGGRKIDNRHGSAPGVFIEDHRGFVLMLPGVPRELRGMMDDEVIPLLRSRITTTSEVIFSRTIRTTGIAESLLQDQLREVDLGEDSTNGRLSLAYLPGVDGVDLRVTTRAASMPDAEKALNFAAAALSGIVREGIYGEDEMDLARVVLDACIRRELRIAVAESCTGGMLGARITAIPGSSAAFVGGVIAYDNAVKQADLGVPAEILTEHGAVSEEVVKAMAIGAKTRFDVDVALAITGIAGPDGGTEEKPVGLVWICAIVGEQVETRKIQSWGDRQEIRYRSAQAVLDLARRMLTATSGLSLMEPSRQ